jgi:hypothetical protein
VRLNKSLRKSLKPSIWGIFAVLPEASAWTRSGTFSDCTCKEFHFCVPKTHLVGVSCSETETIDLQAFVSSNSSWSLRFPVGKKKGGRKGKLTNQFSFPPNQASQVFLRHLLVVTMGEQVGSWTHQICDDL